MLNTYTACYTKIPSGYMGQLVEWPEVITEGKSLEDCREMLQDALQEMIAFYREEGRDIPLGGALIEQLPVEVADVRQARGSRKVFRRKRVLVGSAGKKARNLH
jgi:predicted RNase H-like HicB family nuclease